MKTFSYQLYSSRNFPPLSDTLAMLREAGYEQVEGYGALYAQLDQLDGMVAALEAAELKMPSGHFGLDMVEGTPERVIEIAGALGIETVYVPFLAPDQRPEDAAGWEAFGARLEEAGKPLRDAGLGFGWHNHDFEFKPLPAGEIPQDLILRGGPNLEVELDIAWVVRGGGDPLEAVRKYAPRITAVHLKDIAAPGEKVEEDGWADLGEGVMDWPAIMREVEQTGAKYFVMEHDNPSDHRRFARNSIATARQL